jgi:hypothetical protein
MSISAENPAVILHVKYKIVMYKNNNSQERIAGREEEDKD